MKNKNITLYISIGFWRSKMKFFKKILIQGIAAFSLIGLGIASPVPVSNPYSTEIATPKYDNFTFLNDKSSIAILRIQDGNKIHDILAYSGPMAVTTTNIINYFYKQYPYIDEITLNSNGGLVTEGIKLGTFFSQKRLKVSIAPSRVCLSACAYAFIGGTDYRIDGLLGFHTGFLVRPKNAPPAKMSKPDRTGIPPEENNIYQQGHYMGALYSMWFMENGFNLNLFLTIAAKTSMKNFYVMNHEKELYQWLVRDDNAKMNDYRKFLVQKPKLFKGATIMSGKDMMMWLAANTGKYGHNNRGRRILSIKVIWSPTIKAGLQNK